MKRYESYNVADFIQDEDFRDWVQGHSSRESFWASFLVNYPEKRDAFRQAEQFIRAAGVAPERIGEAEIRREVEHFMETASSYRPYRQPFQKESRPIRPLISARWGMAIAAMLVAAIGAVWYFLVNKPVSSNLAPSVSQRHQLWEKPLVETTNETQQPLRLVLNDGSEVLLSPHSQLRYPSEFTDNARMVYLKGEGSFSVKRQNQPFMVFAGDMVTRVLGTRFVVRAFDVDKKITVQVLSGKVSVYKAKPERSPDNKEVKGLILTINQAAIFEKSDGNLTKTLVANPTPVVINRTETQFVYDQIPLPVILRELEKNYGIPIQFDEQIFYGCKITASLTSEPLYEKLEILCKAASASYEITDGQIVISRK